MTALFLYGTLRDPALYAVVSGEGLQATPARLPGYRVDQAANGEWPTILADPGCVGCEGIVVRPSDNALKRMDYYEGAFGYTRANAMTDTGTQVTVYLPPDPGATSGQPWSLDGWAAAHGDLTRAAAALILAERDQRPQHLVQGRMAQIRRRAASQLTAAHSPAGTWRKGQGRDTATILTDRIAHDRYFQTRVVEFTHPTFAGSDSGVIEREVFMAGDAVTVLPYDPVRDRVLLVEQFRAAALLRGDAHPWTVEVVAGRIDPGETTEEAARRETLEEAGQPVQSMHRIGGYYASTGTVTEYVTSYVGLVDLGEQIEGTAGVESEGEDIRHFTMPFDQALAGIGAGEVETGPLMISLLWLAAHRARLRG